MFVTIESTGRPPVLPPHMSTVRAAALACALALAAGGAQAHRQSGAAWPTSVTTPSPEVGDRALAPVADGEARPAVGEMPPDVAANDIAALTHGLASAPMSAGIGIIARF